MQTYSLKCCLEKKENNSSSDGELTSDLMGGRQISSPLD